MSHFKVTVTGIGQKFVQRQAQFIKRISERQLEAIARETEEVIKQKIRERINRVGSEGNLENSFTTVPLSYAGWGVGDIDFLNKQAPYWYWQNFGVAQSGRTTPPRSRGQFSPGIPEPTQGQSGGRWYQSNTGGFLINPTKPITAKNYIDATLNEVNQIIARVTRRVK